jgi:hypothetical protein
MQSTSITKPGGAEYAQKVGNIISKSRLARGWNPYEGADHDLAVAAWLEILLAAGIPGGALNDCYKRAQENNARALAAGKDETSLTANALVAAWLMGVRDEYAARKNKNLKRLAQGETYPGQDCPRCYGLGREYLFDENGNPRGVGDACDHRRLEPGEGIYKKLGGDPRDRVETDEIEIEPELAKIIDAGAIF